MRLDDAIEQVIDSLASVANLSRGIEKHSGSAENVALSDLRRMLTNARDCAVTDLVNLVERIALGEVPGPLPERLQAIDDAERALRAVRDSLPPVEEAPADGSVTISMETYHAVLAALEAIGGAP